LGIAAIKERIEALSKPYGHVREAELVKEERSSSANELTKCIEKHFMKHTLF